MEDNIDIHYWKKLICKKAPCATYSRGCSFEFSSVEWSSCSWSQELEDAPSGESVVEEELPALLVVSMSLSLEVASSPFVWGYKCKSEIENFIAKHHQIK